MKLARITKRISHCLQFLRSLKEWVIYLSLTKNGCMPIIKVIEVIASSEKSIDDAVRSAVAEAAKTIRNIDSVYVKDIKAHVKDNQVTTFGVICKISFRLGE